MAGRSGAVLGFYAVMPAEWKTLAEQISVIVVLGALTVGFVIPGVGDWFLNDRRWRGSALLLCGLTAWCGLVALCATFAG